MQVNSINSNQNFGMALKLKSRVGLDKFTKKKEEVEKLYNLGEEFKKYKTDIIIDEEGRLIVQHPNKETALSDISFDDKKRYMDWGILKVNGTWAGSRYANRTPGERYQIDFHLDTQEDVQKVLDASKSGSYLDGVAEFVRALEKHNNTLEEEKQAQLAYQKATDKLKDNLFSQFSIQG